MAEVRAALRGDAFVGRGMARKKKPTPVVATPEELEPGMLQKAFAAHEEHDIK
jgi:hypothetical protein